MKFLSAVLLLSGFAVCAMADSTFVPPDGCDPTAVDPTVLGTDQNRACLELTLDPANGILTGSLGATAGWGYTIVNPSPYFILLQGTQFLPTVDLINPDANSPLIYCGNSQPSLGGGTCYNDIITLGSGSPYSSFAVIGPNSTVSQPFDFALQTGFASFFIDPNVTDSAGNPILDSHGNPVPTGYGLQAPGTLLLDYDAFTTDPTLNFDPNSSVCAEAPTDASQCGVWAGVAFDVEPAANVPEPGSMALVSVALFGLGLLRVRSVRRREITSRDR